MRGPRFTTTELLLCVYAARYAESDFGGLEAIERIAGRHKGSIRMKIRNIVAMLDDHGIARAERLKPLSGRPKGECARETDWSFVQATFAFSREVLLHECKRVLEVGAVSGEPRHSVRFLEGHAHLVTRRQVERSPLARLECIRIHGTRCRACGLDFGERYGNEFAGFIHIHHVTPLSELESAAETNPETDLIPLCPNCHSVVHMHGVTRTVEQVQRCLGEGFNTTPAAASPASS